MKQMYKVFLNDRVIKIGSAANININKSTVTFSDDCTAEDVRKWFTAFTENTLHKVSIIHSNPEHFFNTFQSAFTVVHAAGGVVIRDDKILFIFRNGKWDLPKGKLDKDELAEEAALREVEEETGITPGGIDLRLPSTFHIYKSPYPDSLGEWVFKNTYWFQMYFNGNHQAIPQQEEGITEVAWIDRNNLAEAFSNTYENLKQIINLYML